MRACCEDGNDADRLRTDPVFKRAMARLGAEAALCSQPTISRLENLPGPRALLRMGRAMVDLSCASFRPVPRRIVLDVDDTFDAVHGMQRLRSFVARRRATDNAHHDEYGVQPIVVSDGEGRFVTAVLRPAKRPSGRETRAFLRRQLRANWPRVESSCTCPAAQRARPSWPSFSAACRASPAERRGSVPQHHPLPPTSNAAASRRQHATPEVAMHPHAPATHTRETPASTGNGARLANNGG